ncbi:MAG: hypothetical protein UW63_C0021G0002 [Candidatus Uhrbacteria bacterium GW2011_GWF2_44_350]|uniref:Uncharacterized protein n=1 Tax=Candidatus Uhrbacteria bacterium GW2011_GWF2_44_350 TaxID=1619000 RepID=A0A0G1LPU2_9BACT|nr:MAG: hypothetical protein UW63_C0021G0002 [Candidatus Uhrbacteria bacterium GW2011_GWF2_44_350]
MSENTTGFPCPNTQNPILVGRIEKQREGWWNLNVCSVSFSPSNRLFVEVKNFIDSWLASGEQELAVQTPPAQAEINAVFLFCWEVFMVGRDIIAQPKWSYNEGSPHEAAKTIGTLSEETEFFADEDLFASIATSLWAYSNDGPANIFPIRGFRSEVAEWRRNLLSVLQKLEAKAETARKAVDLDRLRSLKESGWMEFTFISSHYERDGEYLYDYTSKFLLRPGLDVTRWEGRHEASDEFSEWLAGLVVGVDYVAVN